MLMLLTSAVAFAGEQQEEPRLLVPYPITGPRDIQASDRITRRYRAVAAHVVPPITDAMASMIEAALLADMDLRTARIRRDDAGAFDRLRLNANTKRDYAVDLLLAGDDVLRAADRRSLQRDGRVEPLPKLLEPIVTMPYVLICATARCGSSPALPSSIAALRPRTIGVTGESSASHFAARAFTHQLGITALIVPYGGGNTLMGALIASQIDTAFVALPLALSHLGHAKIRPVAIGSERRYEHLADLPTLRESDVPLVVEGWFAVFASDRMPAPRSARLGTAIRSYRLGPITQAQWLGRGLVPITSTAEHFEKRIGAERVQARTAPP